MLSQILKIASCDVTLRMTNFKKYKKTQDKRVFFSLFSHFCKKSKNYPQNLSAKSIRKIYPQNLSAKFIHKIYPQNLSAKSIRKIYPQNILENTEHFYYKQDLLVIGD